MARLPRLLRVCVNTFRANPCFIVTYGEKEHIC